MKILIVSLGIPGHLNPLLAAAAILADHHEVVVHTSAELGPMVAATGLPFIAEPPESSTFVGGFVASHPEFLALPPGSELIRFGFEKYVAANIPRQAANLMRALREFPADLILADSAYAGTLPLLLGPRQARPAIAHLGITVLNSLSGKNVPPRPGVPDHAWQAEQKRFALEVLKPVQAAFDRALHELGLGPLPVPALESLSVLPDLYIHPGIEDFEYPNDAPRVHFIGRLPMPAGQAALPDWWHGLDRTKRVVLVTQGTVANRDFGQLVGPALTGLANEPDVVVLVTTGGRPIDSIAVEIPSNAYAATFLPFESILPSVDLLITNGGYGTVNMALAYGVPIVAAGLTEDKEEVSAHVEWSGAGIDLRTNQADAESVRRAARDVLDTPGFLARAKEMATVFASHDAASNLLRLVASLVTDTTSDALTAT